MKIVHRLYREQHNEVLLRAFFGGAQVKLELTAPGDDILEHLVDRVLIGSGSPCDDPPHVASHPFQEPLGGHVGGVLGSVRK